NSGPFLSLPVLAQAFPQGLDVHDADHARRLRMAFDEWDDNQLGKRPDSGLHRAWMKFVLAETLGYDELLAEGQAIPQTLKSEVAEYGETLRPDWIVNDPATKKARLLVQVFPRSQSLTKPVAASRWKTSPDTRIMQLLHDTGIRLGIVTNGDHWMLVNAPKNETTGYVSWYANLWLEEKDTLRAFRTLLGADRLFSVPEGETLEALLDKSANDQQEVTDQLGYQVRKAVEVLIQALDKADQEHGRKLLGDVNEKVLYESALTVMMRLVFLFCAEERELLLLGDDLYDKNYAVSTLREQLRVTADQFGEEILGLRYDAWTRLLTTFRAVYAGAKHDRLKLPAYGGSLFNPDRFPFLEGRKSGTNWKNTEATPLPVSNRTVLHLLEALQVLQTKIGNTTEARKISFRALDIEQIGHVYEGLLDHTAKRATEPVLGLAGTRDKEPEIALAELERIAAKGEKELLKFLKDESGRSESAIKKGLNAEIDDQLASRFRTACQDSDLWKRVKPFAGLVRLDDVDYPVVITTGSVFVTAGTDRRSSGTHYTPKSLTEPIVQYTLEPLVYVGPAEGLPKEQWKLRPAKELLALKICDMACGSGAFLVQACRYMAARLLEAWDAVQRANPGMVHITPEGEASSGKPGEMLIPDDPDERQTYALRIVAQRCLYGVDINPLAAEMAKLSLWLLTLAKDKPFEFLDHAIRHGDSLVGIHNTEQLRKFNLDGKGEDNRLFLHFLDDKIKDAITLRRQITEMQAVTVEDVEAQDRMLREANEKIDRLKCAAELLVAAAFNPGSAADKRSARDNAAIKVAVHFNDSDLPRFRQESQKALAGQVTFHWPLEFPEVMIERGGFDAVVGNPPFMGGSKITGFHSTEYRSFIVDQLTGGEKGKADLSGYFLLRGIQLLGMCGVAGLLTTNSISQGDNRKVCLEPLAQRGNAIIRAIPSLQWPGDASVTIAAIWVRRSNWHGCAHLNGHEVRGITSFLAPPDEASQQPFRLPCNIGRSFRGTEIKGEGFILSPEEAEALITENQRNRDVIVPFLTGQDITSFPIPTASRFVINFQEWDQNQAAEYHECFAIVTEKVKPFRDTITKQIHEADYWKFWDKRLESYARLASLKQILVRSERGNMHSIAFVENKGVFANTVIVIGVSTFEAFACLQSSVHEEWCRRFGGAALRSDMSYSPKSCFETFAFPVGVVSEDTSGIVGAMADTGRRFYTFRQSTMSKREEGLTSIYNRFHDAGESADDIQQLRELHVEMDNAVVAAYGWTDLDLGHDFHEAKQGVRYTISELARREVLARLLKLNHERYAEEVKQGLHEKKKGAAKKTAAKSVKDEATLFDLQEDE
ncbi:MAG: restriction endonuclease, partial [Planctomycetota bacterium]|nr:restriction endonuclease [Planctomycetota bacterium]